jgi:hypothetical protein
MESLVWIVLLTVFFLLMLVLDLRVFHRRAHEISIRKLRFGAGCGSGFPLLSVSACTLGKARKVRFSSSPATFWKRPSRWTMCSCSP